MLDAGRKALALSVGASRELLDAHESLAPAIVRYLEVLGEAARGTSASVRNGHPEIPWLEMIGTRNRLIHAYRHVDLDIVWRIVTVSLPPLISQLEALLGELRSSD